MVCGRAAGGKAAHAFCAGKSCGTDLKGVRYRRHSLRYAVGMEERMNGKNPYLYYGGKVLGFFLSMAVLSFVVFYIARLAPGDPLVSYYGERAEKMAPDERAAATKKLGLDNPVSVQYIRWIRRALRGDFGISYKYKTDVTQVIGGRIGNTLLLGGTGFILIFVFSLLLGILCAWFEDRFPDRVICKIGTITSCIPEFWLSLVLILIFAVNLHILPGSGAYTAGREGDIKDRIWHLILPMTIVVTGHLWYYAFMIRNKILEEIRSDYVLLAKAKGLSKRRIMFRQCLRNVMPAYLSIMAISVPHIMGGTYIIETVFSYPGIGTLSYESARFQDYNLLMVLCMLSGGVVILCNMAAQTINELIDPRIRSGRDNGISEVSGLGG
jgi:peptide/nickel transport system permease protein